MKMEARSSSNPKNQPRSTTLGLVCYAGALIVLANSVFAVTGDTSPAISIPDAELIAEPARSSDSFVDSIGVATHWNFLNSVYNTKWKQVQGLLGELGVRTVRDALDARQDYLWTKYGIQLIAINDDPAIPLAEFSELVKRKRAMIAAIEGPNEVNGGWAKCNKTYEGKGWPVGPHHFQDDLYRAIKSDPELKDIPVIALSTCYKNVGPDIAPLRSFDYANAHSYAGGQVPSSSIDFRDSFLLLGHGATLPPLVATESGYHTCTGNTKVIAGSQKGVSHEAHRKYIPRQAAEYFRAGFRWAVIYELAAGRPNKAEQEDPEAAFGLLMPDGETPKPAYFALKNLITTLSESQWDYEKQQWIKPIPWHPLALAFALQGASKTIHHNVLQRSDGSFQLLLWNEIPSFDLKNKSDLANNDAPVRLILNRTAKSISVFRLGPGETLLQQFASAKEIDLKVPDEVIVVNIKFAEPVQPARPEAPVNIEAKTTPTSVELSWPFEEGVNSYWVYCNQRNLGYAQRQADGKAHIEVSGLLPSLTYPFEIVATSLEGGVSLPANISVTTMNTFPDLVVKSLKITPESPQPGAEISFVATIANVGNTPTEDGVLIGSKFSVDGKTVCWNDTHCGPLAPGKEVEIKPTNGFNGRTSWVMAPGCHNITVMVDDLNRLIESNERNNKLSLSANTGTGPDFAAADFAVKSVRDGKLAAAEVVLKNTGIDPIPKGTPISARVDDLSSIPPTPLGFAISCTGLEAGHIMRLEQQIPIVPGENRVWVIEDDVHRIPQLNQTSHQTDFDVEVAADTIESHGN